MYEYVKHLLFKPKVPAPPESLKEVKDVVSSRPSSPNETPVPHNEIAEEKDKDREIVILCFFILFCIIIF